MKNKIITAGFVFFVLLITANLKISQNNQSSNISLNSVYIMAQAITEEGYPIGKYCAQDDCHKQCGVAPYVYTADGHYWHCKWKDTAGSCDESLCEKACDAMCVNL